MSKFIKGLKEVSHQKSSPIGFGAKTQAKILSMLLIARLPQLKADRVSLAISAGADAVWSAGPKPDAKLPDISKIAASAGEIPLGVEGIADTPDKIIEAGYDFVVMNTDVLAHDLANNKIGKVLSINGSLEDNLVMTIGHLPVNAVLLSEYTQSPLTMLQLMHYQKLISFCGKLAIALLPSDGADLEVMRNIGISGVVVDFTEADSADKLTEVKKLIQELPKPRGKREGGTYASLPGIQYSAEDFDDDDE